MTGAFPPEIPERFWRELEQLGQQLQGDLDVGLRARLGNLWLERARNEHASIASFDRFALGLLSVGAPPELLEWAHVAALDEIRHAQLCFALASTYANDALGPGPLDLSGALETSFALRELCEATILEGCVGETLAAIEARACGEGASVPAVRTALELIAADEARHSELAWAFVRWALTSTPAAIPAARDAFQCAAQSLPTAKYACRDQPLEAHGFLSTEQAERVRATALEQVVRPAAANLGLL